jgi:hypothetical protein
MRFSSTASVATFSLLSGANAIITSITAPSTIALGQPFTVTLNTQNYIQAVYDVAFAVGIAPGSGYPQSLGEVIGSDYLGPSKSNILTAIPFTTTIATTVPAGPAVLSATVFSLIGAVAGPYTHSYNVSITIGTETSSTTITSDVHF